jgi:hypothetical protein
MLEGQVRRDKLKMFQTNKFIFYLYFDVFTSLIKFAIYLEKETLLQ